jgi:hypothetical protein
MKAFLDFAHFLIQFLLIIGGLLSLYSLAAMLFSRRPPSAQPLAAPSVPKKELIPEISQLLQSINDEIVNLTLQMQSSAYYTQLNMICSSLNVLLMRDLTGMELGLQVYFADMQRLMRITKKLRSSSSPYLCQEDLGFLDKLLAKIESDLRDTDIPQPAPSNEPLSQPEPRSHSLMLDQLERTIREINDPGTISLLENCISSAKKLSSNESDLFSHAERVARNLNLLIMLTKNYIEIQDIEEQEFDGARAMARANIMVCNDEITDMTRQIAQAAKANIAGINEILRGEEAEELRNLG